MATATSSRRNAIAVGLILVGLLSLGMWRLVSGSEHQAFAKGATPPASSKVTAGDTYSLAVPGGATAMLDHGISKVTGAYGTVLGLTCQWSIDGSANQALTVSAEAPDTKAETTVGHFTAPASGNISVSCDGWGRMFIPDAESGSSDPSGLFLLLSIITLTIGASLALSAGYQGSLARAERRDEYAD
ncbi:hypothetical protein [Jatrophihabitans sp.]|uniref:hypothetical protein n=1 Tax=Jatrophihabitans sp. TaxID=1932789 RepID=UPI0030C7628F|nr:hypothetical protein [Jatrophihabitans sp.]